MSTISEKIGLTKEVDGTHERKITREVTVVSDVREYVADAQKLKEIEATTVGPVVPRNGDGNHPSPFHADPLYRGVTNPTLVRRSLTRWEAIKAVFSREIDRPLVAIEVETVFEQSNLNTDDSFS